MRGVCDPRPSRWCRVSLEAGQQLGPCDFTVTRADLVRYAGASGDFNPIHWSDRVAHSVGLPGVIAHGMYTLALGGRAVAEWAGGSEAIVSLAARFTRPVVVPDDDTGAGVRVEGVVSSVADGRATIKLTVTHGGEAVLGMASAVVAC